MASPILSFSNLSESNPRFNVRIDSMGIVYLESGNGVVVPVDFIRADPNQNITFGGVSVAPGLVGTGNTQFANRVGVQTNYWMRQPIGAGAALSIGAANDLYGIYFENESGNANSSTCYGLYGGNFTSKSATKGKNIGGLIGASNAVDGNIGLVVQAQYAGAQSPAKQIIEVDELGGGSTLKKLYINADFSDFYSGTQTNTNYDIRNNGTTIYTVTPNGISSGLPFIGGNSLFKFQLPPTGAGQRADWQFLNGVGIQVLEISDRTGIGGDGLNHIAQDSAAVYDNFNAGTASTFRGQKYSTTPISANYTILSTDDVILATGGITVTLPSANAGKQRVVIIKSDSGAGAVTVSRVGTDIIEGTTSKTLTSQYQKVILQSDGSGVWYDLASGLV